MKISENIKKGIVKLEKEEKNMIIASSFISKINKNKKRIKALFKEFMKSLNFFSRKGESS